VHSWKLLDYRVYPDTLLVNVEFEDKIDQMGNTFTVSVHAQDRVILGINQQELFERKDNGAFIGLEVK